MLHVPANAPPELQAALQEIVNAIQELQQPGGVTFLGATTLARLPPAERNRYGQIIVTDRNCIAVSTPVAGVWTWLRADGSAL